MERFKRELASETREFPVSGESSPGSQDRKQFGFLHSHSVKWD